VSKICQYSHSDTSMEKRQLLSISTPWAVYTIHLKETGPRSANSRTAPAADETSFSFSFCTIASAHIRANTISSMGRTPQILLQGRRPRRGIGNFGATLWGKGCTSRVRATVSESSEVQVDLGFCPKGSWKKVKVVHFEGPPSRPKAGQQRNGKGRSHNVPSPSD